ncbi:MAG: efflux RND transporter periplasmic adaptor subunit, partial [Nitrospira sp.]|nr:efflux RND transporter periplasmic adaptor subunit [Nitrospira sp.]
MRNITSPQHRWMIFGTIIVIVVIVIFVFQETMWNTVQPLIAKFTDQDSQTEPSMDNKGNMNKSSSPEMGTSQAYAMVNPARQQLIGVKTAVVDRQALQTVVRAVGRVEYDEQRITHVNLRMAGWVEDLFVDYTGQLVRKGQPLFTLYSQELVATQEEYLLALRAKEDIHDSPLLEVREQGDQLLEAARDRLRLWTITDNQIEELARRGKPQTYVTIYSPATGFVVEKKVFKGMYVEPELTVYSIANLSILWVLAEVFEYEVPFIQVGQSGTLTLDAHPGETFHGKITYIYPYLNQQARTVKVRLVFQNPNLRLKPDMYGTVRIEVKRGNPLAVPEEAVLDSGTRKVVFVARGEGMFEPREVTLGPKVGSYFEVNEGLQKGERIVTSGTFLLDSESKLMASSNMMGALGMGGIKMEQAQMGKMDMGGMDMDMKAPEMAAAKKMPDGMIQKKAGGLTLAFSTDPTPSRMGENRILVTVKDAAGKPVSNAKVQLTFTMPMPGMIPATVSMAA